MDPRTSVPAADAAPEPPLASHAAFLRSLAKGLLFDKTAAGDVAQRAMLLALQRKRTHDEPRTLRGWLAGVVRNLALQSGREERRRAERERAAASSESVASAADEVARLETMERLLAAVRRLEPACRATVMMRFFDQLKPGAIAKRTGVPVETVRTRLRRGLERLRAELDARHGGDRAAWGVALLPTALPAGGGVVGGVVGKVTGSVALHALAVGGIGALAMSSKVKLLVGGIVALAATAVIVEFARDGGVPRRPDDAPPHEAPLAAPVIAKAPPAPAAESSAPNAQRAPEPAAPAAGEVAAPFVVRGRTLDSNGKPLAHSHVKVARYDGYETDVKPGASATVESDGDGAFAWGLPLPRGTVTLTAAAAEPAYFGESASELLFAGDPPRPLDVKLHSLDCDVVGRVTGEGDRPLGDAKVKLWIGAESDCDESGEYHLKAPSSLGQIFVTASAPDHVSADEHVDLGGARGRSITVDFRLRPGGRISGLVRDESGQPIEGAKVETHRAWLGGATSDRDGRYELSGIDPLEQEHFLSVTHPDFAAATARVTAAGGDLKQDFVLLRGASVTGFVFDADGKPARGAKVWAGDHPHMWGTLRALAHDDGSFSFRHVKLGAQKVGADLDNRPSIEKAITVAADPPRLDGIELRFTAGHTLAGRIEDKEGKPVAGATILTRRNVTDFDVYTRSDDKGHFALGAVPAETQTVEASAQGFERAERRDFTLDRDDLVIVLAKAGGLAGTVVDAESGAPLERFRIRFVPPRLDTGDQGGSNYEATWQEPGRVFEKSKGIWTTRGESLPQRTIFGVEASADGYAPSFALHVMATESPDPAAFVLRLGRGATVSGTVVDADGAPVEGAAVRLVAGRAPANRWFDSTSGDPRWSVRTSATGSFTIEGAAAGDARLLVSAADAPNLEDGPFEVPATGSAPPRTIRLERGGAIEGVACDAQGRPSANRLVLLFDIREAGTGAIPRSATTDGDGRFRFGGLRPGRLQLSLVAQRAIQQVNELSMPVTVAAGATASVRLEAKGDARIRGRIVGDLTVLDSLTVSLHRRGSADVKDEGPAADGTVTDRGVFADGDRFEVQSLPAGRYAISANGQGRDQQSYWYGTAEVTVAAGGEAEVEVTLRRGR